MLSIAVSILAVGIKERRNSDEKECKECYSESNGKAMAKVSAKAAVVGANSASMLGFHQPKEPEDLKKMKK